MDLLLKILAGIILAILYILSPAINLLVWLSSLGMKLVGGCFCLVGVISFFENAGTTIGNLLTIFLGLTIIGIGPFISFVSVLCEETREKLFTYITGYSNF